MDLNPMRHTSAGDADGMLLAFELVLTPTIMGFLGFLVDRWVGTLPAFTVSLAAFTLAYTVWKVVNGYDRTMAIERARYDQRRRAPRRG